jgi:hypothetical protein
METEQTAAAGWSFSSRFLECKFVSYSLGSTERRCNRKNSATVELIDPRQGKARIPRERWRDKTTRTGGTARVGHTIGDRHVGGLVEMAG